MTINLYHFAALKKKKNHFVLIGLFSPVIILMVQWTKEAKFLSSRVLLIGTLFDSGNPGGQNTIFPQPPLDPPPQTDIEFTKCT